MLIEPSSILSVLDSATSHGSQTSHRKEDVLRGGTGTRRRLWVAESGMGRGSSVQSSEDTSVSDVDLP